VERDSAALLLLLEGRHPAALHKHEAERDHACCRDKAPEQLCTRVAVEELIRIGLLDPEESGNRDYEADGDSTQEFGHTSSLLRAGTFQPLL